MELSQLCRIARSSDYLKEVKRIIEYFQEEVKDMKRKPRYFTVCIDEGDNFVITNRLLPKDTPERSRLFSCTRLSEQVNPSNYSFSEELEKKLRSFFLYNVVMLAIEKPYSDLPLLINEDLFDVSALVKSRLESPKLWNELRPLCLHHNQYPICQLRYAGKQVDMYLSPISLMNYILGLDHYKKPHGYLAPNDGLIPHNGAGFYTGFYY